MQITGKVHRVEEPTSRDYNGKVYKEQKVVIETTEGQYTQQVGCSISRDNIIGTLQVGQTVTADINLRGRDYTNKQGQIANFTTVEIWRVQANAASAVPAPTEMLSGSESLPF